MRHRKKKLRLNRFTSWRRATVISLARNLLLKERIFTTAAKARAAQPLAERLITLGKQNSLIARRQAYRIIGDHSLVSLLFKEIAPRFNNRIGGYTRKIFWGRRRGDNAKIVVLELTEMKKREKRPKREKSQEEKMPHEKITTPQKPPLASRPSKKIFGGLRGIFKKERDSL
jgi:large subunit ribosomal protein L17